jgi:leucyl aminopeptidase
MDADLPVRLTVRIGCVENSVSGEAMRPLDVIRTRKGLSVEIGNTDAEGRLVLCDLLAEASEEAPDVLLDFATLTGAARVALGPDLPALFCNDDRWAETILSAGRDVHDPVWRLPLWSGYDMWLESNVADLNNVTTKPGAGAITAALFLQRFVGKTTAWAHVDTYAWNDANRPGRPEGGEGQGVRAIVRALTNEFCVTK